MVRILTICQHCGDVEVTLDDISVRVWAGTDQGEYTLQCPECTAATVWAANPETIDVLAASGAELQPVGGVSTRALPVDSSRRSGPSAVPASAGARRRRRARGRSSRRRPPG